MSADTLLARLEKVRQTGPDSWRARCPAHGGANNRSLSIAEREERVLLHCFAGCGALDVLGAVGLDMAAVMPPRPENYKAFRPIRRPYPAADVLEAVADEALIVAVCASSMAHGIGLSETERVRLITSAARLQAARRLANG